MAGLCAPLSTLRQYPHGYWRMTRGRCGSLLLHRDGLAPSTPCRSPGALRSAPNSGHSQRPSACLECANFGRNGAKRRSGLPKLANADAVIYRSLLRGRDVHQPRLVDKLSVKFRRTCKSVPGFDAEKPSAAGFRPDTEFTKSLPRNVNGWTVIGCVPNGCTCELVQNNRVIIEKLFRKRERV